MGPRTLVSSGGHSRSLARRDALLIPSVIPCSISPLTSGVHYSLFSGWRRTVSPKFFHAQVLLVFMKNHLKNSVSTASSSRSLCTLSSLLQRVQHSVRPLSSKESFLQSWDTRPRTPLISFCAVQLRTLCAARSLASLSLSMTPVWIVAQFLGLHGLPPCPHSSEGIG